MLQLGLSDSVTPHLPVQGGAIDLQLLGCLMLVPVVLLQGLEDQALFKLLQ